MRRKGLHVTERLRERDASPICVRWVDPDESALLWTGRSTDGEDTWLNSWLFRLGAAAIFVVNGIVGIVQPEDFTGILQVNVVGSQLSAELITSLVWLASINDLALGAALISGQRQRLVYSWMVLWLCVIAGTKLMNLLW